MSRISLRKSYITLFQGLPTLPGDEMVQDLDIQNLPNLDCFTGHDNIIGTQSWPPAQYCEDINPACTVSMINIDRKAAAAATYITNRNDAKPFVSMRMPIVAKVIVFQDIPK